MDEPEAKDYHKKLYSHLHEMRSVFLNELGKFPNSVKQHAGLFILKTLLAEMEHLPSAVAAMSFEEHRSEDES